MEKNNVQWNVAPYWMEFHSIIIVSLAPPSTKANQKSFPRWVGSAISCANALDSTQFPTSDSSR